MIEVSIKIKTKSGTEIVLDDIEAREVYDKLKEFYDKPIPWYRTKPWTVEPIFYKQPWCQVTYNTTSSK